MKHFFKVIAIFAAMALTACGGNKSSEAPKSSSAAPSDSLFPITATEAAPTVHVHDWQDAPASEQHTPGTGEVTTKMQKCACGATQIWWDAQDAAKECENFSESGKLTGNDVGYVQYKVWSPSAMKVSLWANCTYQSQQQATKDNRESNQAAWYNYKDGEVGWKYKFEFNGAEVDQSAQKITNNDGEEIEMAKAVYEDFEGATTTEGNLQWVELNLVSGVNTIKITRHTGYAVSFVSFGLVKAAA